MLLDTPLPCFKLGLRFGRDDIVKRFLASGRSRRAAEKCDEVAPSHAKLPVEGEAYPSAALCVTAKLAAKCSDGSCADGAALARTL